MVKKENNSVSEKEELKKLFLIESKSAIKEISENIKKLKKNPDNKEALERIFSKAHSLGGNSVVLGNFEAGYYAGKLEQIVGTKNLNLMIQIFDSLKNSLDPKKQSLDSSGKNEKLKDINERLYELENEKRAAHEELERSEGRLRKIIEKNTFGMLILDKQGNIQFLNEAAAILLNKTKKSLIGKSLGVPIYAGKKVDLNVLQKNKKNRIVEANSVEIEWNDKPSILVSLSDITEERIATENIKKSEEKFKILSESSPVGVFNTNAQGDCLYVNNSWLKIAGMKLKDALGKGWLKAIHPDDVKKVSKEWYDAAKEKRQFKLEYRFKDPKGKVTFVVGQANPELDSNGNIIGHVGTITDITYNKKLEDNMKERVKELKGLYSLGNLTNRTNKKIELINMFVEKVVPPSMRYPRDVFVLLELDGKEYCNSEDKNICAYKVKNIKNKFSSEIFIAGKKRGRLTVGYLNPKLNIIKEYEDDLINGYAERLGKIIERLENTKQLNFFRLAIENSTDAVGMSTPEGVHYYQNQTFTNLFGEIGKNPPATVYVNKKVGEEVFKTIMSGKIWIGNVQMYDLNKNVKYIYLRAYPLKDKKGEVLGLVGLHTDITKRTKSEKLMEENELKYRTMVESSKDAIMTLEPPNWRFTSGNPSTLEMFGAKNEEEWKRVGPWDVSPTKQPDGQLSPDKAKKMIEKAMKKGSNFFEWTHKRLNGEEFPATVLLTKFKIKGKDVVQATVRDLSKLKKAYVDIDRLKKIKDELEKSKQSFNAIVERSIDGIIVVNNSGVVKYINNSAKDLLGKKAINIVGSLFAIATDENDIFEVDIVRSDGNPGKGLMKAVKTLWEGVPSYLMLLRDVTDEKKAEEKIKEEVKKLRELEEMKDQFLNITSHELKTPITPIKLQAQMFLEGDRGKLTEDQKESAEIILRNMNRLDNLITDILDISRIQSKRLKLVITKEDLKKTIEDSILSMKPSADQKNISLTKEIDKLPMIPYDKERLGEVLINLLNNAIKFTPPNGKIIVTAKKRDKDVIVNIKDNGIGIKKEDLERLFKPFSQISPSYKKKHVGTGLGLAISKGIIESQGGKIGVISEGINKGSTFYFTLPLERKDNTATKTDKKKPTPSKIVYEDVKTNLKTSQKKKVQNQKIKKPVK